MKRSAREKNTKECLYYFVAEVNQPENYCAVTSSGGSLHLAGLRNNTGLEFNFSILANLAGVMSPSA